MLISGSDLSDSFPPCRPTSPRTGVCQDECMTTADVDFSGIALAVISFVVNLIRNCSPRQCQASR